MQKYIIILFMFINILNIQEAMGAPQTISATLTRPEGGGGDGGGGTNTGGIIAGGAVGGATAGASALAFAPLLLAGLEPNSVICAAAPLNFINPRANYLENAIKAHGGVKSFGNKFYIAQNDCEIINGTYDIDEISLPKELMSANRLKVNITIASQGYKEVDGEPELALGVYKGITRPNLAKKFETQQFLHHYLMKKYDTQLKITYQDYNNGIQKLSGIINMKQIQNKQLPIQTVVRYTDGGFHQNLKKLNPKILTYAYVIEFEK